MSKPNICFLDGYTLSPGDLDISSILELGNVDVYPRTAQSEVVKRSKNAEIIITNKCVIDSGMMDALPNLKMIQVAATGYNNIDVVHAAKKGIVVCNVAGYGNDSVAQHVFAMLLGYLNRTITYSQEVRSGEWTRSPDFSYWHAAIRGVAGQNFGIIGYGQIGRAVAKIALAFDMNVIVSNRSEIDEADQNISFHSQDYIFKNADVLSLHVPLNESTDKFINADTLRKMKKNLILINTGRGGLINEDDLYSCLKKNIIDAALLDVLTKEPPLSDNLLLTLNNCFITPHQAWANIDARRKLLRGIVENILCFLKGKPINTV